MSISDKRKALLIGNNTYDHATDLLGCTQDVLKMKEVLEKHGKGDPNFNVMDLYNLSNQSIQKEILELLKRKATYALLFFSGHGTTKDGEGFLCGKNSSSKNGLGVSMKWISDQINESKIPEITVILDCCHAGEFGNALDGTSFELTGLRKGVTILAATTSDDYAMEFGGKGIFTSLLYDGLNGSAADLLGHVTPVGLYNCAETILNPWQQRPVFKSFVDQMTPLRYCLPQVKKRITRQITDTEFFHKKDSFIELSKELFGENEKEQKKLSMLSSFERSGLLQCPNRKTLNEAILNGDACYLSPYGQYIWQLVKNKSI